MPCGSHFFLKKMIASHQQLRHVPVDVRGATMDQQRHKIPATWVSLSRPPACPCPGLANPGFLLIWSQLPPPPEPPLPARTSPMPWFRKKKARTVAGFQLFPQLISFTFLKFFMAVSHFFAAPWLGAPGRLDLSAPRPPPTATNGPSRELPPFLDLAMRHIEFQCPICINSWTSVTNNRKKFPQILYKTDSTALFSPAVSRLFLLLLAGLCPPASAF